MPSKALSGLTHRLVDVDEILKAHAAVAGAEPGRKRNVGALNRASVLLLNAHFEGYLEDAFSEALASYGENFDARHLHKSFMNPTPDKIDDFFELFGMKRPSRKISWKKASNKNVVAALNELVLTRNKIAHGEKNIAVRKTDVLRYRKYVEGFARTFDDLLCLHILKVSGKVPWLPS